MTHTLDWALVASDFEVDGALRDIVVQDTGWNEWQRFCEHARSSSSQARLTSEGREIEWPSDIRELFLQSGSPSLTLLTLRVGPITVCSHFFTPLEIEADIDPREITEETLPMLLAFVRDIGQVVRRDVVVTHENALETAFLRYRYEGDLMLFIPPGDH